MLKQLKALVAMAVIAAATCPARAQEGPRPMAYTDFSNPPVTEGDKWWARVYQLEPEVLGRGNAFAAHYSIGRPWARQEFGVFFSERLCLDIKTIGDATVSKCPAELITYPKGKPYRVDTVADTCVVRIGTLAQQPQKQNRRAATETHGFAVLKPGVYMPTKIGCAGLGGASSVTFDGQNFSGHYQVCRTVAVAGIPNHYSSSCLEGQGTNWPKAKDIDASPDKMTVRQTIIVISSTTFVLDDEQYEYCAGTR
ncbi:hypothetical protein SAMN05519104_7638 [Rhizobiales bacterium GAS188]|nr:hypothetical protein SAMN05519104_7638 [Rhizobiales bacterium GAS188]